MNSTNNSLSPYERPWLRDEIFAGSLTVISLYLVIVLSIFEHKRSRQTQSKPIKQKDLATKIENFLSRGSLCLVAVVFTLFRCISEQIELRFGRDSNLACRIYQHELVEVYHISLTCLYLLLWARQLKMYRHRALRHLSTKFLRVVSYIVLIGILGSSIATATSYLVTFTLIKSPQGCVYDQVALAKDGPPSSLPGILLFLISFVFQFSLLALLIYPLVKHYKVHLCGRMEQQKGNQKVRETVLRLFVCTTICVVSDCVASNLLIFVHDGITPIMFWANIYTVNLLFNIIAVICSFADWRNRLFPFLKFDYQSVAETSAPSASTTM